MDACANKILCRGLLPPSHSAYGEDPFFPICRMEILSNLTVWLKRLHERSKNMQNEIVVHWLYDDIELFLRVEFAFFFSSLQIHSDLVCATSSPRN